MNNFIWTSTVLFKEIAKVYPVLLVNSFHMKEDLERRKICELRIAKKNDKGEESLGYVHITG